ncbi:dihydrodipicolinate synthase family protein [Nonomuraea fuscirosea]|uniref:dihydrodipicolinate synthase family protein n=1 Tax=Nonomuraea fuscirosea TaxID=1291556 RepID=UPI003447A59C
MSISGLIPILATPFTAAGELDVPSLRRLTEWQFAAGADGVAVFGMASEGFALTTAERARILTEVRQVAGSRPVVAGVGSTSTATAVEQALAAAEGGADALMVLPPYLVKPSGAQLVDFYGVVAERAGIDVMVQDAPGATGVSMPESLIVELSKLDGVTSVKIEAPPTAPKVGAVAAKVGGDFAVFGGQNALFCLEEYARGAVGTMPACEFTDLLAPILKEPRQDAFARLLPLIRFGMQPGLAWAVHKEVLVRRGLIESSAVRSPAKPLDPGTLTALDEVLTALPELRAA